MFNNLETHAVYKAEKNIVERARPQVTIWRMHIGFWIPKATNTLSECVIRNAFPLQQWLQERASILRYTYISCLVGCNLNHNSHFS